MRYSIIIMLVLFGRHGLSQPSYDSTLSVRLDQIKKLPDYNNTVVVWIDSIDYCPDACFPYWKPNITFYEDDICRYMNCQYRSLKDSTRGMRPDTARTYWKLREGPSPYLFLRDTAKIEDLKKLVQDKHPYVKTYAFGALVFRNHDSLLPIIIDNLKDTTKILEYTGDYGRDAYPADLMIEYAADRLTDAEKRKLKKLITSKYSHLSRGLEILERK